MSYKGDTVFTQKINEIVTRITKNKRLLKINNIFSNSTLRAIYFSTENKELIKFLENISPVTKSEVSLDEYFIEVLPILDFEEVLLLLKTWEDSEELIKAFDVNPYANHIKVDGEKRHIFKGVKYVYAMKSDLTGIQYYLKKRENPRVFSSWTEDRKKAGIWKLSEILSRQSDGFYLPGKCTDVGWIPVDCKCSYCTHADTIKRIIYSENPFVSPNHESLNATFFQSYEADQYDYHIVNNWSISFK